MIIEGCILIVLAIVFLILSVTVSRLQSFDDYKTLDGVISKSDIIKKEVIVDYKINGVSYSATYCCEIYANVGEMPPEGLKVQVMVNLDTPDKIMFMYMTRKMGKGLSGKQKYIDNVNTRNRNTMIFGILILFLSGVYLILHEFSII